MLHIGLVLCIPWSRLPGSSSTGGGQGEMVFPGEFFPCVERLAIDFPVFVIPMSQRMKVEAHGFLFR